jgi:predicted phage terminase large subunit-like protein
LREVTFWLHEKINLAWQGGKKYVVCHSGRGASKSTGFGGLCIGFALQNPGSRVLCIRGTQNKISESSLQILKDDITLMGLWDRFESSENQLCATNGAEFLFYGAKAYESFRSLQRIGLVWIDEANELSEDAWDVLIPTIRPFLPGDPEPRFLIGYNPRYKHDPVHKMFVVNQHPEAEVFEISYNDNPYFPETLRRDMEYCKATNYAKYLHIWEGQLRNETVGALWKYADFRYGAIPESLHKIVVAVDPSGTSGPEANACGIIAVGKFGDNYTVIEDQTGIMSPLEWASTAINTYRRLRANAIIYEDNFGGDMVATIIRQIDKGIPIKAVHASRGKILRAEPIKVLYEQGLVTHAKPFPDLEYEMTTYTGEKGQSSPNRLDALVWGLTELSEVRPSWGVA